MSEQLKFQNRRRRLHDRRVPYSSLKTASFTVFAKVNQSISAFCRRVARFFSHLSRIAIATHNRSSHKGFEKFKQETEFDLATRSESENNRPALRRQRKRFLLPPLNISNNKRKTIFLDLDETLIHASRDPGPSGYDFVIRPNIYGNPMIFYVLKRPGVDEFLEAISKKFEVVIFTAALKPYAKSVLDRLDPNGVLITHQLYRDSCREVRGKMVKDLSRTGRDLNDVVIVDDNPNSYAMQPENAIPISPFISDARDRELEKLVGFFQGCDPLGDMRDAVKLYRQAQRENRQRTVDSNDDCSYKNSLIFYTIK